MGLIGNRYVEAYDPGAVGTGYQWLALATGNLYERDTTNSAWVLIGNVDQIALGNLPVTGGAMSGAITGVTGWAPDTNPNFTTSAKRDGVELATMNDLATLQSNLEAYINAQIQSAFESLPSLTISNNIAIGMGTMDVTMASGGLGGQIGTVTIPRPQYSDGVTASSAECKHMITIAKQVGYPGAYSLGWIVVNTSGETYSIDLYLPGTPSYFAIEYLIVAIRTNT